MYKYFLQSLYIIHLIYNFVSCVYRESTSIMWRLRRFNIKTGDESMTARSRRHFNWFFARRTRDYDFRANKFSGELDPRAASEKRRMKRTCTAISGSSVRSSFRIYNDRYNSVSEWFMRQFAKESRGRRQTPLNLIRKFRTRPNS